MTNTFLSIAELVIIVEALDYAYEQIHDSYIPIFEGVNGGTRFLHYTDEEAEQAEELIDTIKGRLMEIINSDGGTIEIEA